MSYRNFHRLQPSDSIVIDDSDDEEIAAASFRGPNATTRRDTRIIGDSDLSAASTSADSRNTSYSSATDKKVDESLDSEDEDLQFMNQSGKVSILDDTSEDEESDEEVVTKQPQLNKNKRQSIYENPIKLTPKSESTPINSHLKKRSRRLIISSDSDSDEASPSNAANFSVKESMESYSADNNSSEESNFKDQSNESINSRRVVDLTQTNSIPKNSKNSHLPYKNTNAIDLTTNDDFNNESLMKNKNNGKLMTATNNYKPNNNKLQVPEKDNVIICSSGNSSENEIDNDAINWARKELGVGNIDPIEAQKKEHLLIAIDNTEKQLIKLKKFTESVAVEKLPDKGAKVFKTIQEHELKLKAYQIDLEKLSNKTKSRISTPKIRKSEQIYNDKKKVNPKSKYEMSESSDLSYNEDDTSVSIHSPTLNVNSVVKRDKSFIDPRKELKEDRFNPFPEIDYKNIPNVPQTSFVTNDLGKKAMETLSKQQSLTHQRLEQLHGSLTTRPTEDQREKDPTGLKITLMPHQQHALAWMKWREKQKPKGGILADDMGLGKTLTMISLILATVNDTKDSDNSSSDTDHSSDSDGWISKKQSKNKHKRYYGGTLVVAPASLLKQWEGEVKNRVKRGLLSVLVFHGNTRYVDDRKLSKFNIVVTTYQTLVREAEKNTGFYKMEWNRIILDEAHYIRNHKSKACTSVCGLLARYRWALTGTPIQNKEMDLYAVLKFLKCSPFDDLQVWKRWVDNKNDAGKQRLIMLMKSLMLRRTKQELQSKGALDSLPDKNIEIVEITMDKDETLAYQKILLFSQNLFAQFLAQRAEKNQLREIYGGGYSKYDGKNTHFTKAQKVLLEHHRSIESHEILVLLLRLRQMCCHPALIHSMLDKQDAEISGLEEDDNSSELLKKLQNMSINENEEVDEHVVDYKIDDQVVSNLLTKKNPVFNDDRKSSKTRSILQTIKEIINKGDKLIVVSQWTSYLNILALKLDEVEDACYAKFTGEVAVKNRQAVVDKLNDHHDDVNILLLSLTAGGVGLNLVGANHLLLVDIHWNPQLEAQAQDRIYRFGQKKSVYIYKFICKDTIEERVKNLQDKKLDIANHVLTGTRSVSSKLTIDDLKMLFS
ncbi:transcription termination factor 2 isoform X1 [Trichogramma pretiosum]|uniref:transcription termination factor 2 isoform X1 n=1 Tax=Trichogramma pretiosum TaxID=7493 RepID=UPI0006C949B3|nr:transcription termination factor 2 isoform X1 [Trichogramma pretiosum]